MPKNKMQWAIVALLLIAEVLVGFGIVAAQDPDGVKRGIAMAVYNMNDLALLKADWFYVWGWCDEPRCIPMVRSMELPPSCPAYLLVGNEPNAIEPYGAPMTPKDAAAKVRAIEKQCPNTKLVVGNVSADDWSTVGGWGSGYNWMRTFLREYRALAKRAYSGIVGVHCYTQHAASYCLTQLRAMRGLYRGEMWVTEFGVLSGDAKQFKIVMDYAMKNYSRVAAYTNRQPSSCGGERQGWELSSGANLVNCDGTLTPAGAVFAE